MKAKHNHAEAFRHMVYQSNDPKKRITVHIFNSRDGVTPFCFQSKEFGVELQHAGHHVELYDPQYKPKPGDLIWRDATEEDKQKWFEKKKEMLRAVTGEMEVIAKELLATYEEDPESYFQELNQGEPVLELVK